MDNKNIISDEKSRRRKVLQDRKVAAKTIEKGLFMVNTGSGKGKSTAAFGLALRALGQGLNVAIIQFTKGRWSTGEKAIFSQFKDRVLFTSMGDGFTWETQDRKSDIEKARKAWDKACGIISDYPRFALLILDELNIVLRYGYLEVSEVISKLEARPRDMHILVTGRNAKKEIIEAADMVTEMKPLKHHFRSGVKAQKGIEY